MPQTKLINPYEMNMQSILTQLGYFTRSNIYLKEGYSETKHHAAEIDVLGFRHSPTFAKEIMIVECKKRRKKKPHDRCLWLKGLMDYFGSSQGILVLDNFPRGIWEFSNKLGILVLDSKGINDLERNLSIDPKIEFEYNNNLLKLKKNINREIKNNNWLEKCYYYLRDYYWSDPVFLQIKRINSIAMNFEYGSIEDSKIARWILNECIILFSLSTIELASYLRVSVDTLAFNQDIINALQGGHTRRYELENQVKQWRKFFDAYLKDHHNSTFSISDAELLNIVAPKGYQEIGELVTRSLRSPLSTIHSPRILDIVLNRFLIEGKKPTYETVQSHFMNSKTIKRDIKRDIKIAKNFLVTFIRINNLRKEYFKDFIELM